MSPVVNEVREEVSGCTCAEGGKWEDWAKPHMGSPYVASGCGSVSDANGVHFVNDGIAG